MICLRLTFSAIWNNREKFREVFLKMKFSLPSLGLKLPIDDQMAYKLNFYNALSEEHRQHTPRWKFLKQ